MRNQFVYATSCSHGDLFGEMAAISMASLRVTNPDSHISLVVDAASSLTPGLRAAKDHADKVFELESKFDTQVLRSRDLKTSLRNVISGDFVYLDSDTFILRNVSSLFSVDADIASARDHEEKKASPSQRPIWRDAESLGWHFESDTYQNSGVVLMRDNARVVEFAKILRKNWEIFLERIGRPNDQPAFNATLMLSSTSLPDLRHKSLASKYNAQVTGQPLHAIGAAIVHMYSGSLHGRPQSVLHLEALHLQRTGKIRFMQISDAIRKKKIWLKNDSKRKRFSAFANRTLDLLWPG